MEAFTFNTAETTLMVIAATLFIIQLVYYLSLYNRIHRRQVAASQNALHFAQELPPLSVIVYAGYEEHEELQRNLQALLEQDYPAYEVIVILDEKDNRSKDFLTRTSERYAHLYHSFIPDSSRYISRKKLALTLGIKASKYGWLVFTDADCHPASNQWLRLMARNFTSHTQVVLGYSGYERGKGWFHKRVAWDNLFGGMRHLGSALAGKPYMGIGRNLAYRRDLFYEQKGFSAHLDLQRGDDDLFVNAVANGDNTRVETDARAVMRLLPPDYKKLWREEKIGYTATSRYYRGWQGWLWGMETCTRLLFHAAWIAVVVVGILQAQWVMVGIAPLLFLMRWGVQAFVVNKTARDLGEQRRYYATLPLFDLLQPLQSLRWRLACLLRKKSEFMRK